MTGESEMEIGSGDMLQLKRYITEDCIVSEGSNKMERDKK